MTFNEFCLSEAIKPKKINFGLNDDANDQRTKLQGLFITFFKLNGLTYSVNMIQDGSSNEYEIGFATSKLQINLIDNLHSFSMRRMGGGGAAEVFSCVFYIFLLMIKKHQIEIIKFNPADNVLGKFYSILIKNVFFLKSLQDAGFKFQGIEHGYFYFKKN